MSWRRRPSGLVAPERIELDLDHLISGGREVWLAEAKRHGEELWGPLMQRAFAEGPVAAGQAFRTVENRINRANLAAVAGTAEAALFPVASWAPLAGNYVREGMALKLHAAGVMTSAATTPGTLTITPRYGTTTGGVSFGLSAASGTLTASKTAVPWFLDALLAIRAAPDAASTGTAACVGRFQCDQVAVNALNFGGTVPTTIDTTTAQGLFIGVTLGSASDTMTPQIVTWESLNSPNP